MKQREKVLCAAIWYKDLPTQKAHLPFNIKKGIVLGGHRHHNVISMMCDLTGKRTAEVGENVEGFLTTKGNFIDRYLAYEMAERNDQIIGRESGEPHCPGALYSEDLY